MESLWDLDPTVDFLNHGSFGATPREVRAEQRRWQDRMEAEPVDFLARQLPKLILEIREKIGAFVGADPAGLALVTNASTGVNTVLQGFDWKEGDEILIADHAYNAVRRTVAYLHDRYGVRERLAVIPFPLADASQIVDAFAAGLNGRTRLVIVDHITSATALIFPVEEIVTLARQAGVPVLVDGAHAPGMLPLQIEKSGADFYTGNLHKWVCTPKGSALLWVAPAWREKLSPLVISHGYGQGFSASFDWTGTLDPSAFLAVPAALEVGARLGWENIRRHNHQLVQEGRKIIAEALKVELPHPDDPALYGAMAVIPFERAGNARPGLPQELTTKLFEQHRIEVPFTNYDHRIWIRIAAQWYNRPEQYRRLADILAAGWSG